MVSNHVKLDKLQDACTSCHISKEEKMVKNHSRQFFPLFSIIQIQNKNDGGSERPFPGVQNSCVDVSMLQKTPLDILKNSKQFSDNPQTLLRNSETLSGAPKTIGLSGRCPMDVRSLVGLSKTILGCFEVYYGARLCLRGYLKDQSFWGGTRVAPSYHFGTTLKGKICFTQLI